ncbi:hypothetical protein [Mycoplasmopsis glycophila]|uniref:Uncharacterized protein n=1 Tax=Mycoplasmopsis glycophila TaxID=171285 RepID=A0A449AV21_9BACT|nr:hypothetical protein [Mycoplasmopsis glycophila]VEU70336.1 Uncharacterised protein [Mycoplasmopsis glycophila]
MGIYESNSSLYVEHQNDIIKDILWISLDSEQYIRLLNGETIEREKDYWSSGDYFVDIDFFSTISLPYAYDNFDGVVPKYNISYNEILNLSDEEYIEFFFNNENLIDENYNEQIKLLNYIKDKVNLNIKLLNDSLKLVLEIYKKRNEAYVKYLYLLMNSLSFLTGAWYQNPPIMREDMDDEAYENQISAIENGPLYKLKNQIANLEERFNKAKEKINELTGSEDENFEAGENGENAKPGSLIYRLRNKNQDN